MTDNFKLPPKASVYDLPIGIPYVDYIPEPIPLLNSEMLDFLDPQPTVCIAPEQTLASAIPVTSDNLSETSSNQASSNESLSPEEIPAFSQQTYFCYSKTECSLYTADSIFQKMIEMDATANTNYMDNKDVERARQRIVIVGSLVGFRGISDDALNALDSNPTSNKAIIANKIFLGTASTTSFLSLYNRYNDIQSDTVQLASLYKIEDPSSVPNYGYRETYLWADYAGAIFGVSKDFFSLTSDYNQYKKTAFEESAKTYASTAAQDKANKQSAIHGSKAAKLSMASQFTYIATVTCTLVSAIAKICEEWSKPREERNDILITQAIRQALRSSATLITAIYRFAVAYFGQFNLSSDEIFELIRGRGLKGEHKDFMYHRTAGKVVAFLSFASNISFAIEQYAPILKNSYENGEDDVFSYNFLGLTKMILQGIGNGFGNFSHKGAVGTGARFYVAGAFAGIAQVNFIDNGGFDANSNATYKAVNASADLIDRINLQRYQSGLIPFHESQQSVEWYSDILEALHYGPKENDFHGMRRFLIVAGLDEGDHDASITEKNSFLVLARAGQVYNEYQAGLQTGQTYQKRLNLAKQIIADSNLIAGYKACEDPVEDDFMSRFLNEALENGAATGYFYNEDRPFLENGSLPQAAYLVFLEAAGVLTEETLGYTIWNSSEMKLIRQRLHEHDANTFRYHILGYDQRNTPLALVYLQGRGIETTGELANAASQLTLEMNLAGITSEVNLMNAQLNLFFSEMQKELESPEFYSEVASNFILEQMHDESQTLLPPDIQARVDRLNSLAEQM